MGSPELKTRIIGVTLDILQKSGLSSVGIDQIAAASASSKSSVSQIFPGGKLELATVALEEAERSIGHWFRQVFHQRKAIARKVETLFGDAAKNVEASEFMKGCPVAAVTLDLDRDSERLRDVCRTIFSTWQDIIASGLDAVPKAKRPEVAELILATLEGALILARTEATKDPLLRAGKSLGGVLARKFQAAPSRPRARARAKRRRR